LYKEKVTDGNKLHIGPVWDYDRAFADGTTQGWVWQITHAGWPFPFWWSKMNSDTVYLKKLWCRWTTLRMNTLSNDSFFAFIDSTHSLLAEAADRNFERWPELGVTDYNASVQRIKNFMTDRLSWMDANINPHGAALPLVSLSDTSACGSVMVGLNGAANLHYKWNTGDTLTHITVLSTGNYTVSAKDDYGCSATAAAAVVVYPLPVAAFNATQTGENTILFTAINSAYDNYTWQLGDGETSTQQSPVHQYADTGSYTVQLTVTDSNDCVATSSKAVQVSLVSGIALNTMQNIHVLPNPFGNYVQVVTPAANQLLNIEVTDVTGRLVLKDVVASANNYINTTSLNNGVYFMRITDVTGRVAVFKLIKQ
jgi:PKD repeat protein